MNFVVLMALLAAVMPSGTRVQSIWVGSREFCRHFIHLLRVDGSLNEPFEVRKKTTVGILGVSSGEPGMGVNFYPPTACPEHRRRLRWCFHYHYNKDKVLLENGKVGQHLLGLSIFHRSHNYRVPNQFLTVNFTGGREVFLSPKMTPETNVYDCGTRPHHQQLFTILASADNDFHKLAVRSPPWLDPSPCTGHPQQWQYLNHSNSHSLVLSLPTLLSHAATDRSSFLFRVCTTCDCDKPKATNQLNARGFG